MTVGVVARPLVEHGLSGLFMVTMIAGVIMTAIDATGLHALENLSDRLKKANRSLVLCGPDVLRPTCVRVR